MSEGSLRRAAWVAALAATLSACAPLPPGSLKSSGALTAPTSPGDFIAPNPNLVVQGIPPVPRSLAEQVGRYNDFAGHRFVDWHPTRREMLVSHRKPGTNTTQIFLVATPLAAPQQLTDFAEPVRTASYEPITGDYLVFERSTGGDEAAQLHRLVWRDAGDAVNRAGSATTCNVLNRRAACSTLLPLDARPGGSRAEVGRRSRSWTLPGPSHDQARRAAGRRLGRLRGSWTTAATLPESPSPNRGLAARPRSGGANCSRPGAPHRLTTPSCGARRHRPFLSAPRGEFLESCSTVADASLTHLARSV